MQISTMKISVASLGIAMAMVTASVQAEDGPPRPVISSDGVTHVPAFDLPPSVYMSKESVGILKMRSMMHGVLPSPSDTIATARAGNDRQLAPIVAMMRARYPVDVVEQNIGGVPTRVVTPKGKPFDRKRVLINLHGGAFSVCWEGCSILESVPIASVGGFKVVSVNYRMAPEAAHPAGVEDVAAVYRELLKSYKPKNIGIYGCSAGGALTGQAAAWLPAHGLPQPGAIGIFGAGAVRFGAGDSAYFAGYADGGFPPPPRPGDKVGPGLDRGYFANANMADPIISPALHPEVMAKFPPTLLITGTRAPDMSPAIYTNSQLLKAGVRSTLIVGEGQGHCFIYLPQFPESQDAYQVIANFFRDNLK